MDSWIRPKTSPYPNIYKEFEGKNRINEPKRKYWIQDLTPEYFEKVIKIYTTGYMTEEPVSKYIGLYNDKEGSQEMVVFLRNILAQKISLICLTKDSEDNIRIAGFNCLFRQHKNSPELIVHNQKIKQLMHVEKHMLEKRNIFEHFKIDCYLSAFGLYVLPEYRGENLGTEILKARTELGTNIDINFTSTVFSSFISQKQAIKAGFEVFVEEDYEEMARIDKEMEIPDITTHTKSIKVMYKKLY